MYVCKESVFWTKQNTWTYEYTTVMTTFTRHVEAQEEQIPAWWWNQHKFPPLAVELWAIVRFCVRMEEGWNSAEFRRDGEHDGNLYEILKELIKYFEISFSFLLDIHLSSFVFMFMKSFVWTTDIKPEIFTLRLVGENSRRMSNWKYNYDSW